MITEDTSQKIKKYKDQYERAMEGYRNDPLAAKIWQAAVTSFCKDVESGTIRIIML